MHVIAVEFEVKPGHEGDFLVRMKQQAQNSLAREPACLQFDVCMAPESPARIFLYEIYEDEAAFQLHLASDHYKDFDSATADWVISKAVSVWTRVSDGRDIA